MLRTEVLEEEAPGEELLASDGLAGDEDHVREEGGHERRCDLDLPHLALDAPVCRAGTQERTLDVKPRGSNAVEHEVTAADE